MNKTFAELEMMLINKGIVVEKYGKDIDEDLLTYMCDSNWCSGSEENLKNTLIYSEQLTGVYPWGFTTLAYYAFGFGIVDTVSFKFYDNNFQLFHFFNGEINDMYPDDKYILIDESWVINEDEMEVVNHATGEKYTVDLEQGATVCYSEVAEVLRNDVRDTVLVTKSGKILPQKDATVEECIANGYEIVPHCDEVFDEDFEERFGFKISLNTELLYQDNLYGLIFWSRRKYLIDNYNFDKSIK